MKTLRFIIGYIFGLTIFGVIIPLLMIYISNEFPGDIIPRFPLYARLLISIPIFLYGLFFAIWSNISLFTTGKGGPVDFFGVSISPRSEHLVITGPYKYTRNPMVFGGLCIYFSLAIYFNSLSCLVFWLIFFFLGGTFLKMSEEKRLLKDFGKEFQEYRSKVPMFIPRFKRKK
ncbi:MAG: isoprenylcysteine carboxylmethyltransferase family protein [Bacteroidota bacterium]|nr:isoprenylcysteine carboxylmethyltransferase family protein [Bacteroidota bacterium]